MGETKNQPPEADLPPKTLETAMERLDQLIKEMETDSLPLDGLISRYEEGVKLVRCCEERLENAEKRIRLIARDQLGKPVLKEFGGEIDE